MACVPGTPCFENTVNAYYPQQCNNGAFAGYPIPTSAVQYNGPDLPNSGIDTGDILTLALQKLDNAIEPVELVQTLITVINQNPSLKVMFCTLVNSCAITPTTTSTSTTVIPITTTTSTTVIPTTTTTTTTQVGPTINLSISYSDNCGSVTTVVPVTFVSGTNFCDLSPLPVFSGNFAGFPSLVYGIYEGQSRTLVKVSDTILEAIGGAPNECVTCPSTTTTTTTALYSVDINVTELTNTDLTIKLWYSTDGGSTWTFYLSGTAGYPNYSTFTGLQFPAGTNVSFGITDNSDVNIEYGSGLFSGDFNSLCGLTNPFVINNISTATTLYANLNVSGSTFVPCPTPSTTTTTTTAFTPSGNLDTSFNIGTGFDSFVYTTSIDSSGRTVAGGLFTSYNGSTRNRLARINSNGSIDTSFNIGTGFNNIVYTNAIDSSGNILVGGEYTTYNSSTQNRLVRLNSDGTKDNSFNVGTGFNATIFALAVDSNGKILVGGNFTSYNGSAQNYLIRLNSDGTKDTSFDIGSGFVGFTGGGLGLVNDIAIDSNGKILIGGNFLSYRGVSSNYLIRLNSDGTVDNTFNIGNGFDSWVVSIKIDPSGKIVAGGKFEFFQGSSQNRIIRLNSNGSKDTSFNIGTGFSSGIVYSIDIDSSGKVLAGSNTLSYQGVSQSYLVRINTDGSRDTTFNTGTGPGGSGPTVYTTNIDSTGRYIISGTFTSYNGTSQNYIARLI